MVDRAVERAARDDELLEEWLSPVADVIRELLAGLPEEETAESAAILRRRASGLLPRVDGIFELMDPTRLEELIAGLMNAADVNARLGRAREVFP